MNGEFIIIEMFEGLGIKVRARAPKFDTVLRALVNTPDGLNATMQGRVEDVKEGTAREKRVSESHEAVAATNKRCHME